MTKSHIKAKKRLAQRCVNRRWNAIIDPPEGKKPVNN
jgi:hypothetical protein